MRVLRRIAPALCALALLVLAIAPASAQQSTLGADGWLYTASVGTYGSFFPRGTAYTADSTVLVLDVLKPDGTRTRLLAPGGDTVAPDAVPFVLWEDTSRRLFLVWEGRSHIHSNVRLVSFDGSTWSEPVQISGNPFTKKSSPRLAITRETYLRDVAGKSVSGVRTTLHIVWYEDDYGDVHILYAPLALENGAPPQLLPPIFDLGDFVPAATTTGAAPSAALLRSPRVVVAADQKAVLIGLADDATHQLVTLRVDVLPVELSAVADDLEKFFDQEQNDPCTEDPTTLAERARAHLVVIGTRFSAYARSYMADALREWLLAQRNGECADGGRAALAERARAHLVVIGRRTLHEVIVAPTEAPTYLLTFDSAAGGLHYDLSLSVEHTVASPPAIAAGAARIHLGGNGSQTLVSWLINRTLYYQEHDGAAWLPRQSLAINDSFTLEQAYSLLDGKAR
jgi:hypothetical protein